MPEIHTSQEISTQRRKGEQFEVGQTVQILCLLQVCAFRQFTSQDLTSQDLIFKDPDLASIPLSSTARTTRRLFPGLTPGALCCHRLRRLVKSRPREFGVSHVPELPGIALWGFVPQSWCPTRCPYFVRGSATDCARSHVSSSVPEFHVPETSRRRASRRVPLLTYPESRTARQPFLGNAD